MQDNGLNTTLKNSINMILLKYGLTVYDNIVALNRYYLTSILINEVLKTSRENTCSELTTYSLLEVGLGNFNLICKVKDIENLLIGLVTDSTKKCCYRELLLTVNEPLNGIIRAE